MSLQGQILVVWVRREVTYEDLSFFSLLALAVRIIIMPSSNEEKCSRDTKFVKLSLKELSLRGKIICVIV